ncbi:nibrin [Toxorhynchites rutilus septentrionalis]|uniref:nibrin n=1 Tax=Toxorhynchites rutilus septentrionalis TaxID=329112 RepID=UPI00247AD49F|nr:nibrin [Toxorhynchites rutilus septentrionalis]
MWYLKHSGKTTFYYIRPDIAKHTVSRSTGDLIIQGDPSISRNHAFLYPKEDTLKIVDAGSRYGTFLNDAIESERAELPKDTPTPLKEGDRVRFGKCQSIWTVCRISFDCITSTISVSPQLLEALQKLGGKMHDSFQKGKTQFLIMKNITTTPKLLMCLIAQVPVVKPEYFDECVSAVTRGQALPEPGNFQPEFVEAYVRDQGINFGKVLERETLFRGKHFIFIKLRHMSQYEDIIKLAGGKCVCAQKHKIAKSYFTEPHVIVMQAQTDTMSQSSSQAVDGLTQLISTAGKRLIPDVEIGLAILYGSLERYCNPSYKFVNVLDLETIPFTQGVTLANNSEDIPKLAKNSPAKSISLPETESRDSSQKSQPQNELVTNSMDYSEQPLESSVPAAEFAKPDTNATLTVKGKRKRAEISDSPKEAKKSRAKHLQEDPPPDPQVHVEVSQKPSSQSHSSQEYVMPGFLSVNHDGASEEAPAKRQQPKRPLKLMLDDGDNLFNFEDAAPKRSRRQQPLAYSVDSSQEQQNETTRSSSPRNADNHLFSFENSTSKRSRNKKILVTEQPETSSISPRSSTQSNSSNYKQFIKPIEIPLDGWLSTTFCELDIKSQKDDQAECKSESLLAEDVKKIKQESDSADVDEKTRIWENGMEGLFQVRVICMNLISNRSDPTTSDRSFLLTDSNCTVTKNNYKAFVKKQNYKLQQTIVKTKPVCVLDNTQDDF